MQAREHADISGRRAALKPARALPQYVAEPIQRRVARRRATTFRTFWIGVNHAYAACGCRLSVTTVEKEVHLEGGSDTKTSTISAWWGR